MNRDNTSKVYVCIMLASIFGSNPTWKLLGKAKLSQTLRLAGHRVSSSELEEHFKRDQVTQLFKRPNARPKFFKINAMPYSYQIDIAKLTQYKAANKGVDQFLLIVDILSRKAFTFLLPNGQMDTVLTKYKTFVDAHTGTMTGVAGDDFFSANEFVEYHKEKKLKLFTSVAKDNHAMRGGNKLAIVDRLTRTLKLYIQKRMASADDPVWTNWLSEIVDLYNSTPHSSLRKDKKNLSPNEAYEDREFLVGFMLENKMYNDTLSRKLNAGFEAGVKVRLALPRQLFAKEGEGFSREIYEVVCPDHCGLLVRGPDGVQKKVMARDLQKVEDVGTSLPNEKLNATRKRSRTVNKVVQEGIKPATRSDVASKAHVAKRVKPRVQSENKWYEVGGSKNERCFRDRKKLVEKSKIPYWMRES